jgi:DNA polymerase-3 subunit beta
VKIICNRGVLHEALQHVGRVVSGRTTLPILSNVLLEVKTGRLRLVAYDMEIGAQSSVAVEAEEEGAITVPARVLGDVVASLPNATVEMQSRDRSLLGLTCGRSEYTINGLPAEEYPSLPEVGGEISFELTQEAMKDMIRTTVFAVSSDETRAILTGVLLRQSEQGMQMVATDSYRLALKSAPADMSKVGGDGTWEAIIPARALQELNRMLDPTAKETPVTVRANDQQIMFAVGPYTLISRLIEGQFPNYHRLLQAEMKWRVVVSRQDLLNAIKRAAIVARAEASKLIFRTGDGTLTITAESADLGKAHEELAANLEGGEVEIGFNAEYLTDVLAVMESDNVVWEMTGALSPAMLKGSDDPDYLYVVMPMQL